VTGITGAKGNIRRAGPSAAVAELHQIPQIAVQVLEQRNFAVSHLLRFPVIVADDERDAGERLGPVRFSQNAHAPIPQLALRR
jgi:hypothetical protein